MKRFLTLVLLLLTLVIQVQAQMVHINWRDTSVVSAVNTKRQLLSNKAGNLYAVIHNASNIPRVDVLNLQGAVQYSFTAASDSFLTNANINKVHAHTLGSDLLIIYSSVQGIKVQKYNVGGTLLSDNVYLVKSINYNGVFASNAQYLYIAYADSTQETYGTHYHPSILKIDMQGNLVQHYSMPDSSIIATGTYFDETAVAMFADTMETLWLAYAKENTGGNYFYRALHFNDTFAVLNSIALVNTCKTEPLYGTHTFMRNDSAIYFIANDCNAAQVVSKHNHFADSTLTHTTLSTTQSKFELVDAFIQGTKCFALGNEYGSTIIGGTTVDAAKQPFVIGVNMLSNGVPLYHKKYYTQSGLVPDYGAFGLRDADICSPTNNSLQFVNTSLVNGNTYAYINEVDAHTGNLLWYDSVLFQGGTRFALASDENCAANIMYSKVQGASFTRVIEQYDASTSPPLDITDNAISTDFYCSYDGQFVTIRAPHHCTISVYNMQGVQLQQVLVSAQQSIKLNTANYAAGIYILKSSHGDYKRFVK